MAITKTKTNCKENIRILTKTNTKYKENIRILTKTKGNSKEKVQIMIPNLIYKGNTLIMIKVT